MPDHGGTVAPGLGPVAAGHVGLRGERRAVKTRAGEDVVLVRLVAAAVHFRAFLVERGFLVDVVVRGVEVGDVARDPVTLRVVPGTGAYPIASVDHVSVARRLALGAQVGAPRAAARAHVRSERLAVPVGALDAAQIRALARAYAGDEERHALRI